ncbi:OmpA family protein [Flavobacterium aestivum]|uniref:OmpA family protein n=1 Tax=Flavobacterium aestivum TaxID=3003257 RepID=UPI0022858C6E|nr:OmpA family protein [Flavobacterium aestivum]
MKFKKFIYIVTAFILINPVLLAQKTTIAKADKTYDRLGYMDAIKVYERVADKGYESKEVFEKLANSYYFNGELPTAAKWYEKLFATETPDQPEYYYRYAQSLKAAGQPEKADKIMGQFSNLVPNDSRALEFKGKKDYLAEIKANSGKYEVNNAGINTQYSDYGATYFDKKIIFTSTRDNNLVRNKKQNWTGQYFSNLYSSAIDNDGNFSNPELFSKEISSKYNESTPVFTKDGQTVYFTRNNYNDGKRGKDDSKTTLLKIYRSKIINGKWDEITQLPFCSENYSVAHPTLSPDEKTLYFASDMPGTLGQSDLFKVAINPDGTFGNPENLGKAINTEGRETFPFVTSDNQLYFASDGHLGLGGLDIFTANLDQSNPSITNIGTPINTQMDDFAFVLNENKTDGVLSSNREGGNGSDDIYKFKKCLVNVKGTILDNDKNIAIPNATVYILDKMQKQIYKTTADELGRFEFKADCNEEYFVRGEKENYGTSETSFKTDQSPEKQVTVGLKQTVIPLVEGTDLAKVLNIPIIYFDLDKSNIREDSKIELEKILTVMEENPTLKIGIRSHTDSRASKDYNIKLSERRAQSTRNFLIEHGIAANRLTAKGYGESQLVNKCSDGVKCTEEEHQKNRRSEFIIIK